MSPPIKRTACWHEHDYSMIIDVRSESEFADDHIPGAVSMPVLNDLERADIGTLYKQVSPFEAKRAARRSLHATSPVTSKHNLPMPPRISRRLSIAGAAVSEAAPWPAS